MLQVELDQPGVIRFCGRMDSREVGSVFDLLDDLSGPLVLDLSGLEYISSRGVAEVVHTWKRLHDTGSRLQLVGVQPRVRQVFAFAGLLQLLEID